MRIDCKPGAHHQINEWSPILFFPLGLFQLLRLLQHFQLLGGSDRGLGWIIRHILHNKVNAPVFSVPQNEACPGIRDEGASLFPRTLSLTLYPQSSSEEVTGLVAQKPSG